MNDRIRELMIQAMTETGRLEEGVQVSYQRFAELIVRECMEVSLKCSHRDDDMGAIIARQIKQHFGVEE